MLSIVPRYGYSHFVPGADSCKMELVNKHSQTAVKMKSRYNLFSCFMYQSQIVKSSIDCFWCDANLSSTLNHETESDVVPFGLVFFKDSKKGNG